jgi:hypothetical protein
VLVSERDYRETHLGKIAIIYGNSIPQCGGDLRINTDFFAFVEFKHHRLAIWGAQRAAQMAQSIL